MLPYLLLALYTLFCWLLYARGYFGRRLFLAAAFVPAALLLAFRASNVGEDTAMYHEHLCPALLSGGWR